MSLLESYAKSFVNLIYPKTCSGCGNSLAGNENLICSACLLALPQTQSYKIIENSIKEIFWGRLPVIYAASFYYYEKDSLLQTLIHKLKYQNRPEIGQMLGKLFGAKLAQSTFGEIDSMVPVPLHPAKKKKRTYNQSLKIAEGLQQTFHKPINSYCVRRRKRTVTQTKKGRFDRWQNVDGIFEVVNPAELQNKHLLLVDDIITTGSTLEALGQEILQIEGTRISVLSLAFTSR